MTENSLDRERESKVRPASRLGRNRFLASENRHRPRPRLVPRLLFRRRRRRRRLFRRSAPLALIVLIAIVCVFGFIDPVP